MSNLTDAEIEEIIDLALATGLASSEMRRLVFSGIHVRYAASLPVYASPVDQLRSDLYALRRTGHLSDGTWPLLQWLKNAEQLIAPRAEAARLRAIRKRLSAVADGPSTPTEVPESWPTKVSLTDPIRRIGDRLLDRRSEAQQVAALRRPSSPDLPTGDVIFVDRARTIADEVRRQPSPALAADVTEFARGVDNPGLRAIALIDAAVIHCATDAAPRVTLAALSDAEDAAVRLGDLATLARHHARSAWIHASLGDLRAARASWDRGEQVCRLWPDDPRLPPARVELAAVRDWLDASDPEGHER